MCCRRAPAVPEIERSDDSVHSLVDVDSPHISSVPSDYESQSIKTDTQADRIEFEEKTEAAAKEAQQKASAAKDRAAAKAKKGSQFARENSDNPVLLGNAVTVAVLGTVLGVGAYRKWSANELSWKVVGAWAGVVGLFGVADYYVSQYVKEHIPRNRAPDTLLTYPPDTSSRSTPRRSSGQTNILRSGSAVPTFLVHLEPSCEGSWDDSVSQFTPANTSG